LAETSSAHTKYVAVAPVEVAVEHRQLRFSGVTRAVRRARLSFALGGRMLERTVDVGDVVRAGQVLARLDERELNNAVARAQGALAELVARRGQSERDLERSQQLAAAKAATSEEVERSRAGVEALRAAEDAANAQLRETQRLLEETVLRAPFAGTVTEVMLEPGEMAVVGRPVVALSGDDDIELSVEVPETVMPHIQAGDAVRLALPVMGQELQGTIKSVARTALGAGRLFPVLVDLPATPGLAAGSTAELILELSTDGAMTVPVEAVVNPGGHQPAVFRVLGDPPAARVEKVRVEVGTLLGDRVIVRGALAQGDRVVVGGQRGLLDGEAVEIQR
jgi:RND family efflux transporter MFP subunit